MAEAAARARGMARYDGAYRRANRRGTPGRVCGELARMLRRDPHRAASLAGTHAGRRRVERELLAGGIRLFEYRPAMTHVKALMVDDGWAVIGSTNVDNRSFEHNDEINVAFREADVAARLRRDFESDLAASDEITLEQWGRRPALEKLVEPVCWILERQQ